MTLMHQIEEYYTLTYRGGERDGKGGGGRMGTGGGRMGTGGIEGGAGGLLAHFTSEKGGGPGGHGMPKLAPGWGQRLHQHLHLLLPCPVEVVLHHNLDVPHHIFWKARSYMRSLICQ